MDTMNTRKYWLDVLQKLSNPVLISLAERRLKEDMPCEEIPRSNRAEYTHLEAFARLLSGIAPWLESSCPDREEEKLREYYADLSRKSIDAATDPSSPDFMNFTRGEQPIVDTAFFAQSFLRAPKELWDKLDNRVKANVINCFKATRDRKPGFNNWLLFSAMIETFFFAVGEDWDPMRVDYALRQHDQWYLGDGFYGDGPNFHADYYNSYVIQPMLLEITEKLLGVDKDWDKMHSLILDRAKRYAEIQERNISPEGTFPVIGRSIAMRMAVFHLLALMASRKELPQSIQPAQVRCALTLVMKRMMDAPGTFDENGWLKVGLCGSQIGLAETYASTGTLYLCSTGLLPLALSPKDKFWSGENLDWTAKKVWSGVNIKGDHAI